jgi:hypothetical protein
LNGDGTPDLAFDNGDENLVAVLLNNGDGTFGSLSTYSVGLGPWGLGLADFNGAGKADIVVPTSGATM